MEFKVTETDKGFIIEDKNGEKAEISFSSIFKKAGRNADGSMPKVETKDASLSIVEIGGEKYVRINALGEDIKLCLHDLKDKDGRVMKDRDYDTLMARLKELGLTTFDRKQGFIIAIYANEINKLMVEAGGEPFEKDWYVSRELWAPVGSCAGYAAYSTWSFYGTIGCLSYYYRCYGSFRCRPSLA